MNSYIHPHEADRIAHWIERRTRSSLVVGVAQAVVFLLGAFIVFYVFLSLPAQLERARFALNHFQQAGGTTQPSRATGRTAQDSAVLAELPRDTIAIPSIGVTAPVGWNLPIADSLNGLQRGVVHAEETVLPGEVGRTVIVGHSAGYWWMRNPWTKVFSVLHKLEPGDRIYVKHGEAAYVYAVHRKAVVGPKDVEVLRDPTLITNELALMTCAPVGTTLNRLFVFANPVE